MLYIATLLGYGDNLITLAVLERCNSTCGDVRLVGTSVTSRVAKLMEQPPVPLDLLFDDVAAFYTLKASGVVAALKDAIKFRRWAGRRLTTEDTIFFEKSDARNRWLIPRCAGVIEVPRQASAYIDRARALRPFIGDVTWEPCAKPNGTAHRLTINPAAREKSRCLTDQVLDEAIRLALDSGTEICLIDVDGRYKRLSSSCERYLERPTLEAAAMALKESDRYLGPDSFFIHLAYYYRVPSLGFFWPDNMYFAPPGTVESDCCIHFSHNSVAAIFAEKFRRFLTP